MWERKGVGGDYVEEALLLHSTVSPRLFRGLDLNIFRKQAIKQGKDNPHRRTLGTKAGTEGTEQRSGEWQRPSPGDSCRELITSAVKSRGQQMAQGSSQSKENMLCPHRGVSFCSKGKWKHVPWRRIDRTGSYHVKEKKPNIPVFWFLPLLNSLQSQPMAQTDEHLEMIRE